MTDPEARVTIVGELYDPDRTEFREGADWRLSTRGVELLIAMRRPGSQWIDAVHGHAGPARFALIQAPHLLLLAFRFGEVMRWNDQPWQAMHQRRMYPDYPVGLPELTPEQHLLIRIYLVDAASGILRGQGLVTWPPHFASAVRRAVDEHLAAADDDEAAGRELDELYTRYPTAADLVRHRALATCKGGQQ
ncbi:hypothetical protein [Saccharopolyspora taberi]|uniref:Uncharacterized protein n=1 Tax=Saccharopolyspora taberi TaxID=60895 RepID=A0ABN3VPZ1_9PSEU